MMFDPAVNLAIALAAGPGRYALLLGSGISRSAGIPTGWEVMLDLITKVAIAQEGSAPADREAWWMTHRSGPPEYSHLLTELAPLPAERAQLLRAYFEPTDTEREEGLKVPSVAHRAIARLVAAGVIRVIVTTNFDRLTEQAIQEEGITPVVVSTADQADGASPLVHNPCTIIKVNGDYLDSRIKNSVDELSRYDSRIEALLDRVLDDYGLIVCGWSGEWDIALRAALERAQNRRYTTYWALRREPSEQAAKLIAHRDAVRLAITDSDQFFVTLADRVAAVKESNSDPESTAVAVAQLKRYLGRPDDRIRLADLIRSATEDLVRATSDERFPLRGSFTNDEVVRRVRDYENLTSKVVHLVATTAYWGSDEHLAEILASIRRVVETPHSGSGRSDFIELVRYPALLMMYAAGMAFVATGRYPAVRRLLAQGVQGDSGHETLMARLDPYRVMSDSIAQLARGGGGRYTTPVSDELFAELREPFRSLIPSDIDYQRSFDRFEYLFSLLQVDDGLTNSGYLSPFPGAFMWRGRRTGIDWVPYLLGQEIEQEKADWAPLKAGMFGGDFDRLVKAKESLEEWIRRHPRI